MKPFPTIITALLLIIASFFLGKCTGSEPEQIVPAGAQSVIDSITASDHLHKAEIQNLQANLVEVEKRKDHHDSIRTIYRTRYQTIREIVPADSVQCFELLAETRLSCDSALSATDSVISDYRQRDSLQSLYIGVQEKQISVRDTAIQKLSESLTTAEKQAKSTGKKLRRTRIIAGISVGIGAVFAFLH